jgi:hypothetical protein
MTSAEHNKYLSWAFLAYGIIHTVLIIVVTPFIYIVLMSLPVQENPHFDPQRLFKVILGGVLLVQMVLILPIFIASYGLWKRKSWSKIAAIVGGAIAATNIPLGTALCVYAFWFLLGDKGKEIYGRSKDQSISGSLNLNNMQQYTPPPQPPNLWE